MSDFNRSFQADNLPRFNGDALRRFVVRAKVTNESQNARFLRLAFGFSLALTFSCIFCQGFGFGGFHLSETFLNWLGMATIGQVAGLFAMVLRQR